MSIRFHDKAKFNISAAELLCAETTEFYVVRTDTKYAVILFISDNTTWAKIKIKLKPLNSIERKICKLQENVLINI